MEESRIRVFGNRSGTPTKLSRSNLDIVSAIASSSAATSAGAQFRFRPLPQLEPDIANDEDDHLTSSNMTTADTDPVSSSLSDQEEQQLPTSLVVSVEETLPVSPPRKSRFAHTDLLGGGKRKSILMSTERLEEESDEEMRKEEKKSLNQTASKRTKMSNVVEARQPQPVAVTSNRPLPSSVSCSSTGPIRLQSLKNRNSFAGNDGSLQNDVANCINRVSWSEIYEQLEYQGFAILKGVFRPVDCLQLHDSAASALSHPNPAPKALIDEVKEAHRSQTSRPPRRKSSLGPLLPAPPVTSLDPTQKPLYLKEDRASALIKETPCSARFLAEPLPQLLDWLRESLYSWLQPLASRLVRAEISHPSAGRGPFSSTLDFQMINCRTRGLHRNASALLVNRPPSHDDAASSVFSVTTAPRLWPCALNARSRRRLSSPFIVLPTSAGSPAPADGSLVMAPESNGAASTSSSQPSSSFGVSSPVALRAKFPLSCLVYVSSADTRSASSSPSSSLSSSPSSSSSTSPSQSSSSSSLPSAVSSSSRKKRKGSSSSPPFSSPPTQVHFASWVAKKKSSTYSSHSVELEPGDILLFTVDRVFRHFLSPEDSTASSSSSATPPVFAQEIDNEIGLQSTSETQIFYKINFDLQ